MRPNVLALACALVSSACRAPTPTGPAAEPLIDVDGVLVGASHLGHLRRIVACAQRHGSPGLVVGTWARSDWDARLVLTLSAPERASSWIAVEWRGGDEGPRHAVGVELQLRHARVVLTFADQIGAGVDGPAGRVTFLRDERRPDFWIDLAGADLFADLRDPARARTAADAALAARAAAEARRIEDLRVCVERRLRVCAGMGPASPGEREDERQRSQSALEDARRSIERHLPALLEEVRSLYPIDDPACALPLPADARGVTRSSEA